MPVGDLLPLTRKRLVFNYALDLYVCGVHLLIGKMRICTGNNVSDVFSIYLCTISNNFPHLKVQTGFSIKGNIMLELAK